MEEVDQMPLEPMSLSPLVPVHPWFTMSAEEVELRRLSRSLFKEDLRRSSAVRAVPEGGYAE